MSEKIIVFSEEQKKELLILLPEIYNTARYQNQEDSTFVLDFHNKIKAIKPAITVLNIDYYYGHPYLTFTITLTNQANSLILFNGYVCKGFTFNNPNKNREGFYNLDF